MINVLITNFNNEIWIEKSLNSLLAQDCKEWQCYIMDDVSTDGSPAIIRSIIAGDSRFELIENNVKKYQVGNYCSLIPRLEDASVCVTLDGDDWLADSSVLSRVQKAYSDEGIWLAWGGMASLSGERTYNPSVEDIFQSWHVPFHLRTWRAFLWKRIDDTLLRDDKGEYFRVAGDLAFMIEMCYLAGPSHCTTFSELVYFYNDENKLCNHLLKNEEQIANDAIIRNRRKKKRIYI